MGLGLSYETNGGSDITPRVQYDARAGRMHKVDRSQGTNGWESRNTDITNNAVFVMDLANIEVGWINFTSQGPSFYLVKVGETLPARPDNEHRQGFRVKLFSEKNLDGVRDWAHNAKCVIASVDGLYDLYKATPEAAQGKLPVVQLSGVNMVETNSPKGKTTNYAPVFKILQWVDRPSALMSVPAPQAIQTQQQAPQMPTQSYQTLQPGPQANGVASGPLF